MEQTDIYPALNPPPSRRGRGRPPKNKPQPQQHQIHHFNLQSPSPAQSQPVPVPFPVVQGGADTATVALGHVGDGQKKRGRGRPPKKSTPGVVVEDSGGGQPGAAVRRGRGRPTGSKGGGPGKPKMKRSGRPPKPKSVSAVFSSGLKRRPGRPPKPQLKPMPIPFAPADEQPAVLPTNLPPPTASVPAVPRPRGRPRRNAAVAPAVVTEAVPEVVASGRHVGRRRKRTGLPDSQSVINADLMKKFQYFQSKVKEAVGVLKPQITSESEIRAIAAIQDLEGLATMDISAPLMDERQSQLQPPAVPGSPQPYAHPQQLNQQPPVQS